MRFSFELEAFRGFTAECTVRVGDNEFISVSMYIPSLKEEEEEEEDKKTTKQKLQLNPNLVLFFETCH